MNLSPQSEVVDAPPVSPPHLDTTIPRPFSLRHRHRPWVAHQKLVALSFFGDAAVVFMSLLVAYLVRFQTGLREVGVHDPYVDLGSYLGHVLIGGVPLAQYSRLRRWSGGAGFSIASFGREESPMLCVRKRYSSAGTGSASGP